MKAKTNDNLPKWYIVACRPNCEHLAAAEISALGQTVYLPSYQREFHHRRQRKWIRKHYPLLTGYLFVLASPHWFRALDCEHVGRILRSQTFGEAGVPIALTDTDVQSIREAQDAGRFDQMRNRQPGMKPGDMVKVAEGAFSGKSGTVEAIGDENIVLLVTAMGRQLRAVVPIENLAKAS